MKIFKKILYCIPLFIGILIVYGAVSGKLQSYMEKAKGKLEEVREEKDGKETGGEEKDPEGKISLTDNFKWKVRPMVEEYDPKNKIGRNAVYGYTVEEDQYQEHLYQKQYELNRKTPEEFQGDSVFNKEKMIPWGEAFDIDFVQVTGIYDNYTIREDFTGLDARYYVYDKDLLLSHLDGNGRLKEISMWSWDGDVEIKNPEIKLVMFDITLTPHSDWVTEFEAVPQVHYLEEKGEALVPLRNDRLYYSRHGELDVTSEDGRPIYFDLGLYDFEKVGMFENPYVCPMRKGETVKFTVGYLIPEKLMDYAYFVFNPDCNISTDYSYATRDIVIVKAVKKEE